MSENRTTARQRIINLSLVVVAGQSGCATVVIAFGAMFVGLWLEANLDAPRGLCIFGMLILSIPFSLIAMLRISISAIRRISPPMVVSEQPPTSEQEEINTW